MSVVQLKDHFFNHPRGALPPLRTSAENIGFTDALDEWIALKCRGIKAWSRSCQLIAIQNRKHWIAALGNILLVEINPSHIERLFIERSELRNAGQTLNLERKYFRGFWRWLMRMKYIPRDFDNYTDSWPCVSAEPVRKHIELGREEETILLRALRPDIRRVVHFALLMGLRVGELYRLTWDMIVGTPGCYTLNIPSNIRKQRRAHSMPVSSKAEAVLGPHQKTGLIFKLPNRRNLLSRLKRTAMRVGIDPAISMHQLRRTWCCRLADAGVPVAAAQRLGGWSSVTVMLKHYYVLPPTKAREFIDKI